MRRRLFTPGCRALRRTTPSRCSGSAEDSTTVPLDEGAVPDGQGLPRPEFIAPWTKDPVAMPGRSRCRALIERRWGELDEKYRLAFVLRDIQGLSTEAAAQVSGNLRTGTSRSGSCGRGSSSAND